MKNYLRMICSIGLGYICRVGKKIVKMYSGTVTTYLFVSHVIRVSQY